MNTQRFNLFLIVMIVLTLLLPTMPAFAQGGEDEGPSPDDVIVMPGDELPAIPDTLEGLAIALLSTSMVGAFASYLLEHWSLFQQIPKGGARVLCFFIIAALLGGAGMVLQLFLVEVQPDKKAVLDLLYQTGLTIVFIFLGGTVWHEKFNKLKDSVANLPDILKRLNSNEDLIALATLLTKLLQSIDLTPATEDEPKLPLPVQG